MPRQIRFIIFIFLAISIYKVNGGGVADVVSITVNIVKLAHILWETYRNEGATNKLMDQLRFFSTKSDMLKIDIAKMQDEVKSDIIMRIPGLVELNRRLSKVFVNSLRIKKSFDNFMQYIQELEKYNHNILKEFALKAVSEDSSGLDYLLEEIHGLVVENDMTSPSAIHLLNEHMEVFLRYTSNLKSPQQLLHNFFDSIMYTEIKGRLTILFSFWLLDRQQQGDFEAHIEKSEKDFTRRVNSTVNAFKKAVSCASRELWRYNPVEHIEGVTYTELKRVFQEYIINEYDLSASDNCYHTCSDYRTLSRRRHQWETYGFRCYYTNEICANQRICTGYSYECRQQITSTMYICPSEYYSDRRYQYIEYGGTERYGLKEETCTTNLVEASHHHSFYRCDSCMCVCDDEEDILSERFFSLEPSFSRTSENYVITGARLVKRKRTMHIQIQEGKLLPNGQINKSTVVWAPLNENPESVHKLIWNKSRGINLDDLQGPEDHVLIGLSFYSETFDSEYQRLHLKIFTAPIKFENDTAIDGFQRFEFISESSRDEIKLDDLDIPTRTSAQTVRRSKSNQYLKLRPSSLQYDVGQSTIPFVDIQEVVTDPPMPMSGAGIYHKSSVGSGGFIALKLFTYNTESYLEANFPTLRLIKPESKLSQWIFSSKEAIEYLSSGSEGFIIIFLQNLFLMISMKILLFIFS